MTSIEDCGEDDLNLTSDGNNSLVVHSHHSVTDNVQQNKAIVSQKEQNEEDIKDVTEVNSLTSTLPTEIWTKIFQRMERPDVVQLRLVSLYFKGIIDEHLTFKVKMEQAKPHTIPGDHVRISDLQMTNFNRSIKIPSEMLQHLHTLKHFCGRGPTHPSFLHHVLTCSTNLETIRLDSNGFFISSPSLLNETPSSSIAIQPSGLPSLRSLLKLSMVSFYHPDYTRYALEEGNGYSQFPNIPPPNSVIDGFMKAVFSMLRPPIVLPLLRKFNLQFEELGLNQIFALCSTTIIPFLKMHSKTLQVLQIHLTSDVWHESHGAHAPFPSQANGTTSMAKLTNLYFKLPDAALNGVFKALWDPKNIPQSTLKSIMADWESPMMDSELNHNNNDNNNDQWDALLVVQQLLQRNAGSLTDITFDGLDAQKLDLFDYSPQSFPLLEHLWIAARSRNVNGPLMQNICRNKIFVHNFPAVHDIYFSNLGVQLRSFQNWIKFCCPQLMQLEFGGLTYENGESIDKEFLETMINLQPGLGDVRIHLFDLICGWPDPYWDSIKQLPIQFSDDDNVLIIQ